MPLQKKKITFILNDLKHQYVQPTVDFRAYRSRFSYTEHDGESELPCSAPNSAVVQLL